MYGNAIGRQQDLVFAGAVDENRAVVPVQTDARLLDIDAVCYHRQHRLLEYAACTGAWCFEQWQRFKY